MLRELVLMVAVAVMSVHSDAMEYCTFTNHNGDLCQALGDANYTRDWCLSRAKGLVGTSCVRVWVMAAVDQVFEESVGPQYQAPASLAVDWAAQRGESEHVQLAMRSYGGSFQNITVATTPNHVRHVQQNEQAKRFVGSIPAKWISARQIGQVFTNTTFVAPPRGSGWWPDPLLPLNGMHVENSMAGAVWLTVSVPSDAVPGIYSCSVLLSGVYNGSMSRGLLYTVNTTLEVWNLTLKPLSESTFSTFFQFQYQTHPFGATSPSQIRGALEPYYGTNSDAVKEQFFDMLCNSRLPPIGYQWLRSIPDMVAALNSTSCSGRFDTALTGTSKRTKLTQRQNNSSSDSGIPFSIMSISDLFGHRNPAPYNSSYFESLWEVLDPVVAQLNKSGVLQNAAVYGFDEAHPKQVYEPLIAQLFGAVKERYDNQLMTIATLHYCPSLSAPIDILVQSYAVYPNGTDAPPPLFRDEPGQYCGAGFPTQWAKSKPRRRYFFYHCFSPRSVDDAVNPFEAKYGAMNSFVNYPRVHNRLMPWWASSNEGVSGWLYFQVSEWRVFSGPTYPKPNPYANHSHPMVQLPSFVRQPNDGFVEERIDGKFTGGSRLTFNVNKYYANVYGGGTTAGDGVLFYPGRAGPIASARSEMWRDGLEDLELFVQLPMVQRQKLIHQLVHSIGGWRDNSTLLESIRRQAAHAVIAGTA